MDDARKKRFLELLEPLYPRLARYALAITRDKEDAKDLVSESVLTALERFDTLREEEKFAGFIFRIALRTYRTRRYRERMKVPFDVSHIEMLEDGNPSPEHAAEKAVVLSALERLPKKMRETVLLFDVADLTLEAVREIQGGTLSGVKSRLKRGHKMLRALLGTEYDAGDTVRKAKKILIEREEAYALS